MCDYRRKESRLYRGYEEYEGSFGSLQVSASSAIGFQTRVPSSHRDYINSPNVKIFSKWRKGRAREFHERAKYLANRKANKISHSLNDFVDDADHLQEREKMPGSPTNGLQRQVWLPKRNFAFRQRAGKLDIRAIARLDLEKITATTDIEIIQRHLENLAFADVTLDDVQHYSDAYFLKLFQIAQLTLEYLMHVQDSLVSHSKGLEKQCEELMNECQQLENNNGQHETEIATLKREIRQKQRTMATLELMLLNASNSNRRNIPDKENAAQVANALNDDLMVNQGGSNLAEGGSIACAVSCVLCEKRFISAEYLLRHQQKRHQTTKRNNQKKKSLFGSRSSCDSQEAKRERENRPTPLPKEVIDALKENNQLSKQLVNLQDQLCAEQDARTRQSQQHESQQQQINSRVETYMEKMQALLLEMEKKQEATKLDLRLYMQEATNRLQMETMKANSDLQGQRISCAGRLEDDEREDTAKEKEAKWSDKVEKMMDTFLQVQALKQHEVDILKQESSKLWSKYNKLKKRQYRPEPRLTELTALDAMRFGLDRGEVGETVETQTLNVDKAVAHLEDKVVQTDEKPDEKPFKQSQNDELLPQESKTEVTMHKLDAIVVSPDKSEEIVEFPSQFSSVEETTVVAFEAEASEQVYSPLDFQQAAHIIGKVALGFLARRAISKSSNWCITIEVASLAAVLTVDEFEYVREHFVNRLHVQVEVSMSANDLRVTIARLLSGNDEFVTGNETPGRTKSVDITATMTYHRVLLHHKYTGAELSGSTLIHELKNVVEVEIIPYDATAVMQIQEMIEMHAAVSDRFEKIKSASINMATSSLLASESGDFEHKLSDKFPNLVRLQALARGFLARKYVELMKITRLMNSRLIRMSSPQKTALFSDKSMKPSWMKVDPILAIQYTKVQKRMQAKLRAALNRVSESDEKENDLQNIPLAEFEKVSAELRLKQNVLSDNVQCRIRLITERLTPMARREYRQLKFNHTESIRLGIAGNAKIQRAVQIEIVRNRLKQLLADDTAFDSTWSQIKKSDGIDNSSVVNLALSSSRSTDHETGKSVSSFDSKEIDQLASAYEANESPVRSEGIGHELLAEEK
ncbi:Zinc finger, C2H2 [Plasmopara halstedii]|uniref:Zinc finger, C2H2 n=1 Tax=Plasmopara halstedii TaxID=4781 RepID=A0A0P1AAX6_PLAHL|nr:Zinc finger, C2H2 [Plasmopara halstedii]CEG37682.1 Zinc finger, C2H2 [Plasmopara halstedii]|eukprot:XP_024574051.1 Zinc finger, C2H2 [Plasmopara halstedii]